MQGNPRAGHALRAVRGPEKALARRSETSSTEESTPTSLPSSSWARARTQKGPPRAGPRMPTLIPALECQLTHATGPIRRIASRAFWACARACGRGSIDRGSKGRWWWWWCCLIRVAAAAAAAAALGQTREGLCVRVEVKPMNERRRAVERRRRGVEGVLRGPVVSGGDGSGARAGSRTRRSRSGSGGASERRDEGIFSSCPVMCVVRRVLHSIYSPPEFSPGGGAEGFDGAVASAATHRKNDSDPPTTGSAEMAGSS